MPKYFFTCKACEHRLHKYTSSTTQTIKCPNCELGEMLRELPKIDSQTEVREVVDPYTNKRHLKDQASIMKERKRKYYIDVEIPRLIEKYSLETCLENKWLIYDDKGQLVINKQWTPEKS